MLVTAKGFAVVISSSSTPGQHVRFGYGQPRSLTAQQRDAGSRILTDITRPFDQFGILI